MSRIIEVDEEYKIVIETIASMDECRCLCNEVCCNDLSDECGSFVDSEFCRKKCPHFQKEDGIITEE